MRDQRYPATRSVGWHLRALNVLVVFTTAVIALTAVVALLVIRANNLQYEEQTAATYGQVRTVRITLLDAQSNYRGHLLTRDQGMLDRYELDRVHLGESLAELDRLVADSPARRAQVAKISEASELWFAQADRAIQATAAGTPGGSVHESSATFASARALLDDLGQQMQDERIARVDGNRSTITAALAACVLVPIAGLVLIRILGSRVQQRITPPMRQLRRVVERQEAGEVGVRASAVQPVEEVARLSLAFNRLAEASERASAERERRIQLVGATSDLGALLENSQQAPQVWGQACAEIGGALGVSRVAIYGLGTNELDLIGDWRAPDHPHRGGPTVSADQLREWLPMGERVLAVGTAEELAALPAELREVITTRGARAVVIAPLAMPHGSPAALVVSRITARPWEQAELEAVERFGGVVGRALTRERYLAHLASIDQQKTDFLATTSHELRTPLTSISGYLEMLADGDYGELNPAARGALEVVDRNVIRLRNLIEDLLFLNRYDSGRSVTDQRPVDLRECVSAIEEMFAPTAAANGVELRMAVPSEPCHVLADREQIERCMINIVGNGIKFTPRGGQVRLGVEVDEETGEVSIECADTGIGVPDADHHAMFQRFSRATNARAHQIQGTGLGLVIVKAIIESHGGSVAMDSTENVGTTVTLTLPSYGGPDAAGGS
ncbi:ATP-binding protein [Propionibacteriaceae bacterium Y1700]|uniref:ATP-binding protein n=1 Tax=Microlunatus sp. Y1700 TaxID=3418487 RepID=UPI003DA72544